MTDDELLWTAGTDCAIAVDQPKAVDQTRPAVAVPGA
jgi:hypothetical protein